MMIFLFYFLASRRLPYGETGILDFFLRLIASNGVSDERLLLHSLRLVGNSCADTGVLCLASVSLLELRY